MRMKSEVQVLPGPRPATTSGTLVTVPAGARWACHAPMTPHNLHNFPRCNSRRTCFAMVRLCPLRGDDVAVRPHADAAPSLPPTWNRWRGGQGRQLGHPGDQGRSPRCTASRRDVGGTRWPPRNEPASCRPGLLRQPGSLGCPPCGGDRRPASPPKNALQGISSGWPRATTACSWRSRGKSSGPMTPRSVSLGSAPPMTWIAAAPSRVMSPFVLGRRRRAGRRRACGQPGCCGRWCW
jgi:hypothetical protein